MPHETQNPPAPRSRSAAVTRRPQPRVPPPHDQALIQAIIEPPPAATKVLPAVQFIAGQAPLPERRNAVWAEPPDLATLLAPSKAPRPKPLPKPPAKHQQAPPTQLDPIHMPVDKFHDTEIANPKHHMAQFVAALIDAYRAAFALRIDQFEAKQFEAFLQELASEKPVRVGQVLAQDTNLRELWHKQRSYHRKNMLQVALAGVKYVADEQYRRKYLVIVEGGRLMRRPPTGVLKHDYLAGQVGKGRSWSQYVAEVRTTLGATWPISTSYLTDRGISGETGVWIWVIAHDGNFYTNKPVVYHFHHSSFVAGGGVLAAGEWKIVNGKLDYIDGNSGHYRAPEERLRHAIRVLDRMGIPPTQYAVRLYGPGLRPNLAKMPGAKARLDVVKVCADDFLRRGDETRKWMALPANQRYLIYKEREYQPA